MFRILYHPDIPREDLPAINRDLRTRLRKAIEGRLSRAPEQFGKPLLGSLHGYWSLRVGDYRVIYRVEPPLVRVIQIVLRRDAYREGILEARNRGWLR